MPTMTPGEAWETLLEGNRRFVAGEVKHPNQDIEHRGRLEQSQDPIALIFGCGDSRVASELIFDQGLGDLFVVRTAGHVSDAAVLGSIEYGVEVLRIPLVVVLGHENCGAVRATMDAMETGIMPPGYIRDIVERLLPSVISSARQDITDYRDVVTEHVRHTTSQLALRSGLLTDAIDEGRLAVVGAEYALADGSVNQVATAGSLV